MPHQRKRKSPDWFNLDDYLARPLSEADWYDALMKRRRYFYAAISIPDDGYPHYPDLWECFREEVPPIPNEAPPIPESPAIEVLPNCDADNFDPDTDKVRVAIDLNRPDAQIVAEIRQLLADNRPPIGSRDRPRKSDKVSTGELRRRLIRTWSNYRILPLFDLWFWHKTHHKKWLLAPVGKWLYDDLKSVRPDTRVRDAWDTLCRALESGPSQLRS